MKTTAAPNIAGHAQTIDHINNTINTINTERAAAKAAADRAIRLLDELNTKLNQTLNQAERAKQAFNAENDTTRQAVAGVLRDRWDVPAIDDLFPATSTHRAPQNTDELF